MSERLARSEQQHSVWKTDRAKLSPVSSLEPFSRSLNHAFVTEEMRREQYK